MAASSRVNASVEQTNISSGWDEAKSAQPVPVPELLREPDFRRLERQLRAYLRGAADFAFDLAAEVNSRTRSLRDEHPGYLVVAAGLLGLACGFVIRRRRSRI
jgi:hypothetical protein